jgi:hypothetical protein
LWVKINLYLPALLCTGDLLTINPAEPSLIIVTTGLTALLSDFYITYRMDALNRPTAKVSEKE